MLIGSYNHGVDEKGRIIIPSKLKASLGQGVVLVRGIAKNFVIYSEKEFEKFCEKYQDLPLADTEAQDFFRLLFASASACEVDTQGRVLIPQELREYAGIADSAVIVGMMNRLEVWSSENLEEAKAISNEKYKDTLNNLAQRGV